MGKPAFVLVHGWSCDRSFFAPQVEHFGRRHRVVAVDLRGHGESSRRGHTVSQNTPQTRLAAVHPEHVAAIVMVDPAPFVMPPERRASAEAMVSAMEQGDQEPRRRYIMDRMFLPTSDRRLATSILNAMLATPVTSVSSRFRSR